MKMARSSYLALLTFFTLPAFSAELPIITLSHAYESAARTNEQILSARESVAQAELLPMRALSRVAPQVSLGGSFMHQREVLNFGSVVVPADQQVYSASFNWPLLQFEFLPRYSQGSAVIDAKRLALEVTSQRVLHGVASSYYEALKSGRLAELARVFLSQAQEHFQVAKAKYEQGEVRKTVMIQAELDVERAKKRLLEWENSVKVAKEEFRSLVGLTLKNFSMVDPPLSVLPKEISMETTVEDLVKFALNHRPDVLSAEREVKSAWADRDAAFTRILPTVGIQGNYSINDPQTLFSLREQWRVGAVVTVPLFQGGEEWLIQSERASQARQAEFAQGGLVKQVEVEVKKAYFAWQVLEKNLDVLKKSVELARENHRMVESQFKEQLASSAEITDAHVSLINTEVELAQEEYNYQLAALTLLKTLGVFRP